MRQVSSIRLRSEAEFLRRHNNRDVSRQKRIRTIKVRGIHLLLICLLVTLIGLVIYQGARLLLTWEVLNVKSVRLVNGPRSGMETVKRLLAYVRGNILSLSLERLREELLSLAEVKDVSISRQLPSTVEIRFILRQPVFQVLIEGRYRVVDGEGVVLYSRKLPLEGLITIRGIRWDELQDVVPCFTELSRIRSRLDHVGFRRPYGVFVKLKGIPEMFYPGEDRYVEKIDTFLQLKKRLHLTGQAIRTVDMRFEDRFYLEFAEEVSE